MGLNLWLLVFSLLPQDSSPKEPPPLSRFGDYSAERGAESYLGIEQEDELLPPPRFRQEEGPRQEPRLPGPDLAPPLTAWRLEWFPDTVLFRNYLADPISPRSGSKMMFPLDGGNIKVENSLGTQRTLFRALNADQTEGIDFGVEGAVISQFDYSESWDMDSADYRFGFPFGYRNGHFSGKFHVWHLTSHRGDEYLSRNNTTETIRYHKNEMAVGMAYDFMPGTRVYVDGGYGFYIGNEGAKRWRLQGGAEWAGQLLGEEAPHTFVACDLKWRQDADRTLSIALQGGIWLVQDSPGATAGLRVFAEYYRGRSAQTQFPDERVEYWAFGFGAAF